jgi:hypothetical protein
VQGDDSGEFGSFCPDMRIAGLNPAARFQIVWERKPID